jgi:hypothetical protein
MTDPDAIIRTFRSRYGTYSWQGQALQYDQFGPPNEIVYRRFMADEPVDTLLYYDEQGILAGVLNTYPEGHFDGQWIEQPGNVNTFVRPVLAEGVHKLLLTEAKRRWKVAGETIAFWERSYHGIPDTHHRMIHPSALNR